jgi:hypothetical protein
LFYFLRFLNGAEEKKGINPRIDCAGAVKQAQAYQGSLVAISLILQPLMQDCEEKFARQLVFWLYFDEN